MILVSELIKKSQVLLEEYGDLPVILCVTTLEWTNSGMGYNQENEELAHKIEVIPTNWKDLKGSYNHVVVIRDEKDTL